MKNLTKQVVVLNNLSSPHIEQVILFVKDCVPGTEDKILAEAEKIVADFLGHAQKNTTAKHRQNVVPWLISGISLFVSFAVCLMFRT